MNKYDHEKIDRLPFIPSQIESYISPIERVSTRVSIRGLNKAIEFNSKERTKSIRSKDDIKFIIDNIPRWEFRRYSQHCMPHAVQHKNIVAIRMMLDKGLTIDNTWSLFNSLFEGDEEISKLLGELYNYNTNDQSDLIPLAWAASIGGKVTLNDIFKRKDMPVFRKKDAYDEFLMESNINEVKYYSTLMIVDYDGIHPPYKHCQCPDDSDNIIKRTAKKLINMSKRGRGEYSISLNDSMCQVVRAYGLLRWGVLESGGHTDIDLYKKYVEES